MSLSILYIEIFVYAHLDMMFIYSTWNILRNFLKFFLTTNVIPVMLIERLFRVIWSLIMFLKL